VAAEVVAEETVAVTLRVTMVVQVVAVVDD
jgi:hypothetical protein